MGIWLWIFLAIGLSRAVLGMRRIGFAHYLWLLLPVDMYGVSIAGVTLKPYMLLCFVLLLRALLRKELALSVKSRWSVGSVICIIAFVIVNMFNSSAMSSVLSACMLLLVWLCTMIYMSECGQHASGDISDAMVAAGVGYGLVFLLGMLLLLGGAELPGLYTVTREEPGIFMQFSTMSGGVLEQTVRLRGFTIDPNSMSSAFIFCALASLMRLCKGCGSWREWAGLIISYVCVVLSNSRMGIICLDVMLVCALLAGYRTADVRGRNVLKTLLLCACAALVLLCFTDAIARAVQSVLSTYGNRAGLNDDYGRFTLWRESIAVLMQKNPLWGVGFGQMQHLTSTARSVHNTWLEFICAGGLIVGGMMVLHFALLILQVFRGMCSCRWMRDSVFTWTMLLGMVSVVICIAAVDNLTYSYLWFSCSVMAAITEGCWEECP